ncbi:MAG: argininosuccinate lyase [Candidatus Bathyarchaeia archaeon]
MSDSLFRSRLDKEFDERTARFHTSVVEDLRMFEEDINGTEAHDLMLYEQGIIPKGCLREILSALEEMRAKWRRGDVKIGAEFEDVHEYIETRVIERIGMATGGMIHTGRSRNDQVMVDMKMVTRDELLEVAEAVLRLIEALLSRAEEKVATMMLLYTHGQHAQIGTFAHYLVNYADALFRDHTRIMECYARVNLNPLGAGPIGGTSIDIDRERTTTLLGFDEVQENSIDATSGRDWAVETASTCAILMGSLSRASTDLLEWSSEEFSYVEVADEYASSSSIMPQKKNPSTLELIRGKSSEVYGALNELLTMVKGLPTGYYQDLQQTKIPLWRLLDTTKTSIEVLTGIIETLKINEENMAEKARDSFVYAVELAETLVNKAGLSFREAYTVTANMVSEKIRESQTIRDITKVDVEEHIHVLLDKEIEVEPQLIEEAMDPVACLERRRSKGSPNPKLVAEAIKVRRTRLEDCWSTLEERKRRVRESIDHLHKLVAEYTH